MILASSIYQPSAMVLDEARATPGPMANFNAYLLADLRSVLKLSIALTPRARV